MAPIGFSSKSLYEEASDRLGFRQKTGLKAFIERTKTKAVYWSKRAWAYYKYLRSDKTRFRKALLTTGGGFLGFIVIFLLILWITLPNIDDPETMFPSQSTVILDRNGVELYRLFSEQDRTYVPGDAISDHIKEATIAIEDERFFDRNICFDIRGFTRAALSQILPGIFVRSGGSTLTQQFAGNALVGRRRSIVRKIREYMLACSLEQKYDKDELLELYLNWIPYGSNAYGIEQASKRYFGKSASGITLAEAAVIASLPQRPSYFNPFGSHVYTTVSDEVLRGILDGKIKSASDIDTSDVTIGLLGGNVGSGGTLVYVGGRADQVLENMHAQGMISEEEHQEALKEMLTLGFTSERQNIRSPHFVLEIEKQVQDLLGIDEGLLERGGFRITTTLDWNVQQAAEKAVTKHKDNAARLYTTNNIALVALSPEKREVLGYVGNADFNDDEHQGKIDMAQAPRQPGSSFKAFTYLSAFEAGWSPGSVLYDLPTKFGEDTPQNFDGAFWGPMTIRRAIGASRNVPAVKAFFLGGGEDPLLSLAARLGVVSPTEQKRRLRADNNDFEYGWPLGIGAAEVPLIEMVQGYASIADGGVFRPVVMIHKITDREGNIRYAHKEEPSVQVIDERLTAEMTSILSDVSVRPNTFWQQILSVPGYQAAAKTGTSNKCLERNAAGGCTKRRPESVWTLGYTPRLIAGVWAGNATSESLSERADGLTIAAPIWHDFMVEAHRKIGGGPTTFALPSRLANPLLSKLSGKLASECTPVELRGADLVPEEGVPSVEDPACQLLKVDKVTGLLASDTCPEEAVEERAFFVPQSEAPQRWPLWEQSVQEWAKQQMEIWNATETHTGSKLPLPLAPTESCDPLKTPGRLEKPSVRFLSPQTNAGVEHPSFTPTIDIESTAEIRDVTFTLDDKPIATFTEFPFYGPVRIPRSIEKSGSHTLAVTVTDKYFNTATDEVDIRFEDDASSPRVTFIEPSEGEAFEKGETIRIHVEASDDGGVERIQFFLDSVLLTTRRDPPYELDYTIDAELGEHFVRAVARDNSGNETTEEIRITVVE